MNKMTRTCSTRAVNIPIPISDVINVGQAPKNVLKHEINTSMNTMWQWQITGKIV